MVAWSTMLKATVDRLCGQVSFSNKLLSDKGSCMTTQEVQAVLQVH
jgi:hypothetical protein